MLKDTIISAFNYDGTLLKWLKKVQEALENASASEFRVNKKGNATISFSIVFANGDTLESGDIILQQGESVTGATIRQGHLILTLSNGNELDAGDLGAVTGFSINDNQHLIVTYQNGTTQDLGAIFNGTTIKVNTLTSDNEEISTLKPVVEVMNGYSFYEQSPTEVEVNTAFAGACKNGNKITFVQFSKLKRVAAISNMYGVFHFVIPKSLADKIATFPYASQNVIYSDKVTLLDSTGNSSPQGSVLVTKSAIDVNRWQLNYSIYGVGDMALNIDYYLRTEITFLLSENLAQ